MVLLGRCGSLRSPAVLAAAEGTFRIKAGRYDVCTESRGALCQIAKRAWVYSVYLAPY